MVPVEVPILPVPVAVASPAAPSPTMMIAVNSSPHPLFASFVHAAFQNRLQTETAVEQMPENEAPLIDRAVAASEN